MVNVVITGSTKGIGKGYAREFLKRGHNVLITGRGQADIDQTIAELSSVAKDNAKVIGQTCDVSSTEQLQAVWDKAAATFGTVDIWLNNAGYARTGVTLLELEPEEIRAMIDANVIGTMKACQVALRGLKAQGGGFIYNTVGGGHDGRIYPGMIGYGTSKRAVNYFTKSLQNETKDTPVKVCMISPGVNITDGMLREIEALDPAEREKMIKPLNFLGDYVETTTPWLVDEILANQETGKHIKWMTTGKMISRAVGSMFNKRDIFARYDFA